MPTLLHLVSRAPLPKRIQLSLQRMLLERAFSREIEVARRAKDYNKVESLKSDYHFEMDMHAEEEDAYETNRLVSTASRMRLSIPSRYDEGGSTSELWHVGRHTRKWCLTNEGILLLRKAVRNEKKEGHEVILLWTKWLVPAVGAVIAIITVVIKLVK
jgi:hypothetical protein